MGKVSRLDCMLDLIAMQEDLKIPMDQVVSLVMLSHGIQVNFTAAQAFKLVEKGLLKGDHQDVVDIEGATPVDNDMLYRVFKDTDKEEDFSNDLIKKVSPKMTKDTIIMANNIFKRFVPEEEKEDDYIEYVAKRFFNGDYYIAKYYIAFSRLFPRGMPKEDRLWNRHFGITHMGNSRWEDKASLRKRFTSIYRSKDIAYLLSGVYLAVENSIDRDSGKCFVQKVSNFFTVYEQWYNLAKKKEEERLASLDDTDKLEDKYTI